MSNPYQKILSLFKEQHISYKELSLYKNRYEHVLQEHNLLLHQGAKSLVLKGNEMFFLVVLAGHRRIDLKKTKKVLGSNQLRLATNQEILSLMGCEIGACYPFGSIIDLETYVDTSLAENATIFFNPGVINKWILLSWNDYVGLTHPKLINIAI